LVLRHSIENCSIKVKPKQTRNAFGVPMKTAPISVCGYGRMGTKFSTSSFVFGKNQFKLVVLLSSSCSKSCKSIGKSKHSFDQNKAKFSVIVVSLVYRKLGKSSRI